jgi:hypothetical protein
MSTRSRIAIEKENGKVESIYCHFDGYPEHNGVLLFEHYKDRDKTQKLIDLGSISVLAPIVDAPEGHTFENRVKDVVVAYGRDRGEKDISKSYHNSKEDFFNGDIEEFGYILTKEGDWEVKSTYASEDREGVEKLEKVLSELV